MNLFKFIIKHRPTDKGHKTSNFILLRITKELTFASYSNVVNVVAKVINQQWNLRKLSTTE